MQELWLYTHVKRRELLDRDSLEQSVRLLCTFVNPQMSREVFEPKEAVDNDGFMDDMKAIDPNFKSSEYEDVLESMS
jgi:hypothetical protein